MKKIIATAIAAVAVAAPLTIVAATPADAASSSPCITRAEFNKIRNGMNLTQVTRIVGGKGRVSLSSPPIVIRDFKTCSTFHVSNVTFWSGKVDGKLYI